jgi:hypothetical protein
MVNMTSFAQNLTISGTIEAEDGTPIEFANAILTANDTSEITGAVTEQNGRFEISAAPNNYTLSVSFIGYETHIIEITVDRNIELGTIQLKADAQLLDDFTVYGRRSLFERRVDRLVFNVESAVSITGGNTIDALRIVPGVRVDNNDQISMIARGNLIVTIDDRIIPLSGDQLAAYLRNIPTENIQSIEIITNPPARFTAEGNAGVINIVMKRTLSDSWNLSLRSSYNAYRDFQPVTNNGIDFNFRKNKLSLFASTSVFQGSIKSLDERIIYYPTETWRVMIPDHHGKWLSFGGNTGFEYRVTDSWRIGGSYNNWNSLNPSVTNHSTTIIYDNISEQVKEIQRATVFLDHSMRMHSANLNTVINLDSLDRRISVDFDYFRGSSDELFRFINDTYNNNDELISGSHIGNKSSTIGEGTSHSGRIDIELPLQWLYLNLGGRIASTLQESDFQFFNTCDEEPILDENQSNTFRFQENTQALFISARKEISQRFHVQAGLRMEHTSSEGYSQSMEQRNKNSYTNLFPTAYIMYRFNDTKALVLNYGKRINRPNFFWMNPFRAYRNPNDFTEGNPFLQPVFAHNFELSFTTSNFEHRIWYTNIKDDIAFFPIIDSETHVVRRTPMNFIDYFSIGFSETAHLSPFPWWSSHNNAVIYYIQKNSQIPETLPRIETISSNMRSNNDFMLNRKRTLVLNIGLYYEFPQIHDFEKFDGFANLYGGIRYNLLDNNLTLALTANDILNTQNFFSRMESNGIRTTSRIRGASQFVGLSATFRIGNQNIWTQRRAGSEEQSRFGN